MTYLRRLAHIAVLALPMACEEATTAPQPAATMDAATKSRTVCSNAKTTEVLYNDQWVPAFLFDLEAFSYPGAYPPAIPGSQWVGPIATASIDAPAGNYKFRTTFKLPKERKLAAVSLSGQIHADNSVTVTLNGHTIFQPTLPGDPINYSDPAQLFSASSGFNDGNNTMVFDLWNDPYDGLNPAALDFCFTVTYSRHDTDEESDL